MKEPVAEQQSEEERDARERRNTLRWTARERRVLFVPFSVLNGGAHFARSLLCARDRLILNA